MRMAILVAGVVLGVASTLVYQSVVSDEYGATYSECLRLQQLAVLDSGSVESLATAEPIATKRCDLVWKPAPAKTKVVSGDHYSCEAEWGFSDRLNIDVKGFEKLKEKLTGPYEYEWGPAPRSHGLELTCGSAHDDRPVARIELSASVDGEEWVQTTVSSMPTTYEVQPLAEPGEFRVRLDLGKSLTEDMVVEYTLEKVHVITNSGDHVRVDK